MKGASEGAFLNALFFKITAEHPHKFRSLRARFTVRSMYTDAMLSVLLKSIHFEYCKYKIKCANERNLYRCFTVVLTAYKVIAGIYYLFCAVLEK